jgi:hypothetical protein
MSVARCRNLQLAFFHQPLDHRGRLGQQGRLNLGVRLSGSVQIGPRLTVPYVSKFDPGLEVLSCDYLFACRNPDVVGSGYLGIRHLCG